MSTQSQIRNNFSEINRILGHRDFRWLWLAQSVSMVGDGLVFVTLALYIVERTGSATDLGLVLAVKSLPLVALLLLGGVWADRLPRQRLMMATDLARFALHGLLAALVLAGTAPLWAIALIEMGYSCAEAFFRPAAAGVLPQTVPEPDIQQATAIAGISRNVTEFAGPALATAIVLGAGAGWAFAVDAATFLLSAACLTRVHTREREGPAPARTSVVQELRAGYQLVRRHAWVWGTLASFCVALFCGLAPWFVLGPVIARQRYGHVGIFGALEAAIGLGTIAGSLAGISWRPRFPMRMAMLAILLWPAAALLYVAGLPLFLVMPATVLAGAGIALFDVWWLTALAERMPPAMLSRVTSYDWMVSLALLPLGYALAGPLGTALGAVPVFAGGSALALAGLAAGLLPRQTRMLERTERAPWRPAPAAPRDAGELPARTAL